MTATLLALSVGASTPAATNVVGALGLSVLATTDARSRHLPRHVVRAFAAAVVISVAIEAWRGAGWDVVVRAATGGAVCGLSVGSLWLLRPGSVAFGDVKVVTVAAASAAALSWRAVVLAMLVACWAGAALAGALALWRRHRSQTVDGTPTIPFIPPLLVGFLAGAWWA